mmetsp:Transcript_13860/g.44385  ORF Transcript_13860/g.44385 Transcript_13860/m.44385 type:complete len:207 (-) Transcript_13860:150-770(-)
MLTLAVHNAQPAANVHPPHPCHALHREHDQNLLHGQIPAIGLQNARPCMRVQAHDDCVQRRGGCDDCWDVLDQTPKLLVPTSCHHLLMMAPSLARIHTQGDLPPPEHLWCLRKNLWSIDRHRCTELVGSLILAHRAEVGREQHRRRCTQHRPHQLDLGQRHALHRKPAVQQGAQDCWVLIRLERVVEVRHASKIPMQHVRAIAHCV